MKPFHALVCINKLGTSKIDKIASDIYLSDLITLLKPQRVWFSTNRRGAPTVLYNVLDNVINSGLDSSYQGVPR